jgi:hypothetical protein
MIDKIQTGTTMVYRTFEIVYMALIYVFDDSDRCNFDIHKNQPFFNFRSILRALIYSIRAF